MRKILEKKYFCEIMSNVIKDFANTMKEPDDDDYDTNSICLE